MGYSRGQVLALAGTLGFLVAIPPAEALPGPAVGDCQAYRHEAVVAIAAVIAVGDNEVWAAMPGCGVARSSSQAFTFVGQYSGPVFLAAATIVWQVVPFVGCTISSFTTQNNLGLGGSSSITVATITMTSNECRGAVQVTVSVGGGAYTWPALFEINIRVEQAPVFFLCGATGGAVNSYTPAQTCMEPQGVPDTQEELQAIADAIAAGFTVQFGNATFGNMTVPTTIRVESSTAEEALPLLLLLAALIFAGYRLLDRPWVWLWVFALLAVGFLWYMFNAESRNLVAVVAFLGGLWLIVLLLNKFGFGTKPKET